jgi:hypothetical protein
MKLTDLIKDPNNANRGTPEGAELIRKSLERLGAGRSVLIDKNGYLIAGNKSTQAAIEAGLTDALVVQTDGSKLVVVQLTDLDLSEDARAKELAIADNRTSEVGLDWDVGVLSDLAEEIEMGEWFTADDMAGWGVEQSYPENEPESSTQEIDVDLYEFDCKCPKCGFEFTKTKL